jgi:hypothetical protein
MEQRRLRLGDILDDYCPRERRVTNHAVVAMIEENVKQTRCTTCDAEHPYKGGQAPRRKRKGAPAALYKEVLAGKPDTDSAAPAEHPRMPAAIAAPVEIADRSIDEDVEEIATSETPAADFNASSDAAPPEADADDDVPVPDIEDGPVHRPLIRATLPRPEGQKDARTPPDFTIRQSGGRGGAGGGNTQYRGGGAGNTRTRPRGGGGQGGNGHRPFGSGSPHGGSRFAGARQGQGHGRGQGGGFRNTQQPRQGGGGRKRSR